MRIIMYLLFALATVPAWAEWAVVGETNNSDFYIDHETIRKNGNFHTVVIMLDHRLMNNTGAMSSRAFMVYDCKLKRSRVLSLSTYTLPKLGGEKIFSGSVDENWEKVPAKSITHSIFEIICAK